MRLPEVKAPKFLTDLVRDLRDRRLLPLVAVLVVAIVAVPIALSKSTSPPPSSGKSLLGSALAANASHLTVVPDAPGLRDYHRRLNDRHATDPFTPPPGSSSSQSSTETQSSAAGSTEVTAENGSTTSGEAASLVHAETKYFTHAIDVKIVNSPAPGTAPGKSEPVVRHDVPTLSGLPGRESPAVVFMGADGTHALLLISAAVQPEKGNGHCALVSADTCQLMLLKPGKEETFAYGDSGHTVRIRLLKISLVITPRPH
jgi:hypothetical protein